MSINFPEYIQRLKIEVLTLCLEEANPEKPSIFNQIFNLKQEFQSACLDLVVKRGVLTKIVMGDSTYTDSFFFRCPKLPSDMDARIGVRRNPQNPNRKQKIFGFNAIIDTSIELTLGIELPVACTTIAGNAEEGKHYIINRKQILEHHSKISKIDLGDVHPVECRLWRPCCAGFNRARSMMNTVTMSSPEPMVLSSPSRRLYEPEAYH